MNLYQYAGNDPINIVDPLGLWQFTVAGAYGYGGAISFGYNSGRASIQFDLGIGAGFKVNLNPNDTGPSRMKSFAVNAGMKTYAEAELGPFAEAELGLASSFETDTCYNWRAKGGVNGALKGRLPGTDLKGIIGGEAGSEMGGKLGSVDDEGFYAEREGPAAGIGGMLFWGGTFGLSW